MPTQIARKIVLWLMAGALVTSACRPAVVENIVTVEVAVTETFRATQIATVLVTAAPQPTPTFATPHPLLSDGRIRQGIVHCTNRAELLESIYPWLEESTPFEMDSFLPRGHWAYPEGDSNFVRYPFDPEKGKALFEEAGWALAEGATYRTNVAGEEMTLKLTTTDASFRQTWAAVFEEQMKACGLQILRFHAPAAWFFGDSSGLRRRDFELAAYAWLNTADPGGRTLYQCDQIPAPENGWRGQNYMGWCNPKVDEAILTALSSLNRETRREAYRVAQEEYARDLPALPLFSRAQLNAANPALENFAPDPVEVYTWNAAQWVLPDQDTIVIGEGSEPASLFVLENSFVANVLKALVYGLDYTSLNYDFQPVMLAQFPTLENGEAARQVVQVQEGESVMDVDGNVVELKPGVILREAEGKEVTFLGGTIPLPQLVVTYTFVDGLRWSDGTPVSKADYEFAYRATCNSETGAAEFLQQLPTCEKIARIDFANDTAYVVTWKPGYHDPLYFLPPIPRLPAHQTLSDGRKLADVSFTQWTSLPEVVETPLGVGPYVVKEWVRGQHILFTASPSYYAGPPATPNLVVRFSHLPIAALAEGAIDVLGWDSIGPDQAEALLAAQSGGKARVYFIPSNTYEHVDFALFVK